MIFNSCSPYPSDVQKALKSAHQNAVELKKVLENYRTTDSLKYESACFLIANMPYHESRQEVTLSEQYNNYFTATDSLFHLYFGGMTAKQIKNFAFKIPDSIRNSLSIKYNAIPRPIYSPGKKDIESITADFLIDNIETSFKVWHTSPLLKNMPFEEFKEVILPYRITDEPLMYSKSELQKRFYPILSKEGMNKITIPIERYKLYTLKQQRISYYTTRNENLELYDLFLPSTEFNCHNQVTWTGNIFRACGIPICYEFTPQWPNRENRHFWSASPDSNGIYIPYSCPRNNLKEDWNNHLIYAGKVYRRTFATNKNTPYFLKASKETLPEILSSPTLQDETYRYHQTVSLELPFNVKTNNRLAYLSYITRSGLIPVAWGNINSKEKKATFHQIPLAMTFILSYYEGDSIKAVGEPFRLVQLKNLKEIPRPLTKKRNEPIVLLAWTGKHLLRLPNGAKEKNIIYKSFKCDLSHYTDMHLLRKYPLKAHLLELHKQLKGSYILASVSKQEKMDTIAVLLEIPKPDWQSIKIKQHKKYRYLSFRTQNRRPLNIAEIVIFGCTKTTLKPNAFHRLEAWVDEPYWNAVDDDVETFVNTPIMDIELKIPSIIKEIRFIPRNGNNQVIAKDLYSLCYFKDGTWKEYEKKMAQDNFIDFNNVPSGGLYLLKNLEYGKEELPFTYDDGQQVWITE